MKKDFQLLTTKNNLLRISAFYKSSPEILPAIILIHGFKGFKDWGYGPYLGNLLSDNGFLALSFNFSHNGIGEDLFNFSELDKFAENTVSLEVEELGEIIDFYFDGKFGFIPKNKQLGLIGHSRGGAIAIIRAAEDERVSALTSWASISYFNRYTERQKLIWRERGFLEIENTRTKQRMKLNETLLDDIENNSERFDCRKNSSIIKIPFLIIHGELDIVVPLKEAYEIFNANLNIKQKELFIVEKTNHTFDIVHPFQGVNDKFNSVIDKTLLFFEQNLKLNKGKL